MRRPRQAPTLPPVDPDRRKLVANERIKITATLLNNAAVAAFVTGIIGPTATDLYGVSIPTTRYWWFFGVCWICLCALLHAVARRVLGDLKP